MAPEAVVLLSLGRHPASGRTRRADLDARALELALSLGERARLSAVHAGQPDEPALRDYLGMGLATLRVLGQPAEADALPALVWHLRRQPPGLLLAGAAAETGEGSGFLPYALAAALGCVLVPDIVSLRLTGDGVELDQALPGGRRRRLFARLPLMATVGRQAPEARASAFGPARRGSIETIAVPAPLGDPMRREWRESALRPRPRRLMAPVAGSAEERLRAITQVQAGRGRLLADPTPEEAARAIYDYLVEESILER